MEMVSIETIEEEILNLEKRDTDELTGSEFLKAASNVDYAALMGVLDNHMSCIKAVCPKEYDAVMSQIHALR